MKIDLSKLSLNTNTLEQISLRIREDLLEIADNMADELTTETKNISRNTIINTLIEAGIKSCVEDSEKYLKEIYIKNKE